MLQNNKRATWRYVFGWRYAGEMVKRAAARSVAASAEGGEIVGQYQGFADYLRSLTANQRQELKNKLQ